MDTVRPGEEKKKISRFALENVTFEGPDWNVEHHDVGTLMNPQFIEFSIGYYKYLTVQRYSTRDAVTALVDFCSLAETGYSIKGVSTFQEFDIEKQNQEKQIIDDHVRYNVNHNTSQIELNLLESDELVNVIIEYIKDECTTLASRPTPFVPSDAALLVGGFVSPKLDGKATVIKTIDGELHYYVYDHWCPLNDHKFDLKGLMLECEMGDDMFVCYDACVEIRKDEKVYCRTFSPIYYEMLSVLINKIGCNLLHSQRVDRISLIDEKMIAGYSNYVNDGLIFRGLGGTLVAWKDIYTIDLEIQDGMPVFPIRDISTTIIAKDGLHDEYIYEYAIADATKLGRPHALKLYHVRARRDKLHPNNSYEIARYVASTYLHVSLQKLIKLLQSKSIPSNSNNSVKIVEALAFEKNLRFMNRIIGINDKNNRRSRIKNVYEYNTHDPPRRIKSFVPMIAYDEHKASDYRREIDDDRERDRKDLEKE
jgi:hypothetical protein